MINFMIEARKNNKTIKVCFGRVLFSGSSGAGKTSFYRLLMNRERSKQHISTRLAEPEQVIAAVKVDMYSKDNYVELYELDIEREISKLRLLLDTLTKPNTTASDTSKKVEISSTNNTIPDEQFEKEVKMASSEESKLCAVEIQMAKERASHDTQDTELISKIEEDEIMNVFTFMDTGGQPQFISIIPAVNSSAMVTFVVHNVAKSLDDNVTVAHGDSKGNPTFLPYTIGCTNLELIKSLISFSKNSMLRKKSFLEEICDYTPEENISYLSFIGTHIDEALADKTSGDSVDKIDKSLVTIGAEAGLRHVWLKIHPNYRYLIPVNNLTSEAKNEYHTYTSAKKIRKKLYDKIKQQAVYNVPIVWLLLELEIRKKCEEKQQKFIPYSEIVDLCEKHDLIKREDDIKNGLRLHHLFGALLYFDEVPQLCDYVFTDYKWLFNNLTRIVYQSYKNYDGDNVNVVIDFEQKGFFTKSLLDKCDLKLKHQSESSEETEIDFKEGFIELLRYLRIIASLTQENKSVIYFMPSLLSTCNFENNQHTISHEFMPENTVICKEAEPLLIQFKLDKNSNGSSSFPRGVYSCLIVYLLQDTSTWGLHWSDNEERVFENLITLLYKNCQYVMLIDRIFYLQVIILQGKGNNSNSMYLNKIKQALDIALKQIGSDLNFEKFVLTYTFICYDCKKHNFLKETSQDTLTCSCNHMTRKTDKHTIWNKETSESQAEPTETGTEKLTIQSLNHYVLHTSIASHWKNLGTELLEDKFVHQLEIFEKNHGNDVKECCREMFNYWLQVDLKANWNQLTSALEKINLNTLAMKIRENVLKGHPVEPQQPAVKPQQPAVKPQQLSAERQQQSVEPQQQSVEPQQLSAEPQQQSVEPQQQPVEPQQLSAEPQQQSVEPQQQSAEPQQQSVEPQQQSVEPQQQSVEPQQLSAEPQQPVDKPQQPPGMDSINSENSQHFKIINQVENTWITWAVNKWNAWKWTLFVVAVAILIGYWYWQ